MWAIDMLIDPIKITGLLSRCCDQIKRAFTCSDNGEIGFIGATLIGHAGICGLTDGNIDIGTANPLQDR